METLLRTSGATQQINLDTALLEQGKIFLEGTITSEMADLIFKEILYLSFTYPERDINLIINSSGGSVEAGLKIYDAITTAPVAVNTFCAEKAYSMAAILFCAGNHRQILPGSKVMIHLPSLSGAIQANSQTIRSISQQLENDEKRLIKMLSVHTGKSFEEIEENISYDHFFDAQQAVEFGLCDEVAGLSCLI